MPPDGYAPPDRAPRYSILHVVDSLETGGLERVAVDLAIAQRDHGHRVAVFSLTGTSGLGPELHAAGIHAIAGGKRRGLDLGLLARLRAVVAGQAADIVHSHNFVPNYHAALAIAPGRMRAVLVNTCHNMGGRLSRPRLRMLYRLSLARTACVAGVGRQVADNLVARGLARPDQVSAVRNGVPMPPAPAGTLRAAARRNLDLPADALVVGCVGRLVALKNHRLLLEQVPALVQAFPRLHVLLLGDGPERDALENQARALGIAGRVHFAGSRGDVQRLLPAMDVFALPSLTEGLSIALLEACAAGLPVVASDTGGNPEIVRQGANGLLFPTNDGGALRASLLRLLGDRPLRLSLGLAAREWVMANASIDAMRGRYDQLYASALAPHGASARRRP